MTDSFIPLLRRRMAENGYKHLTEPLASPEVCWESWELLLARDVI